MTQNHTPILTSPKSVRVRVALGLVFAFAWLGLAPGSARASFGLETLGTSLSEPGGAQVTQAGAHPDFTTTLNFTTAIVNGQEVPPGNVKDIHTMLPPGLVGFPNSFQRCTQGELKGVSGLQAECAVNSQVGIAEIGICFGGCSPTRIPIYNMEPPAGVPGQFGLNIASVLVFVNIRLHHDGGSGTGGYALQSDTESISQSLPLGSIKLTLWGVPASPMHNSERYFTSGEQRGSPGAPASTGEVALMRNPTSCASELNFGASIDAWNETGNVSTASTNQQEGTTNPLQTTECARVPFAPTLSVQPTTTQASAPTGLEVTLGVPQTNSPHGISSSDLRDASVTLPPGMTVNPSAASGLGACGPDEIALSSEAAPTCPQSSKIGEVTIDTPLLETPLEGSLYQARQGENPFGSTLALYLVASGSGVVIKLPGLLAPDPSTGQLTATFNDTPQLPFSKMTLRFKGGDRAPLSNPSSCGVKTASAQLGSWAGASASVSSEFTITGPCGQGAFAPSFNAGTTSNVAGSLTGFTFTFARNDGEQTLGSVQTQLPPGLLGYIKNVPLCPEPQAAHGACGEQSLIGHTTVAAGAGASPFTLTGNVYLTGPYDGAPYGLSVDVPAVAGPFNLGLVVVRAAINVDPGDAHLTVTSSPLPTILQGIPLQVRMVNLTVDRPGFMFNPTSCAKRTVSATLSSNEGAGASVSSPFQLAGCAKLAFTPKLTASTGAHTSKANGAYLHVRIAARSGQANIGRVAVQLPKQLPSRLTTLQKACPAATFQANPASCPVASRVGTAKAVTPILRAALVGPAYLVSYGGGAFPDLEIVLQGEGITLVLDGKTHITKGITSSTFNTVPDAPFTTFDLELPQGRTSVFSAYGSLCKNALTMPATLTGQNGVSISQQTRISVAGCPKHRSHAVKKARRGK